MAPCPVDVSINDKDEAYTAIFNGPITENFERLPKSPRAFEQQVAWCTAIQRAPDKYQTRMTRLNRLAAYEAGWMSMSDIVILERAQQIYEKHGVVHLSDLGVSVEDVSESLEKQDNTPRDRLYQEVIEYLDQNQYNAEAFLEGLFNILDPYLKD